VLLPDGEEFYDIFIGTSINPETNDPDSDGIPNYLDSDSDDNGFEDAFHHFCIQ